MRIISGKYRGRRLQSIPGNSIRPTSDRVKEAMFSILGTTCRQAAVLDLFAGTGALGLEALSRGARQVVFIDKSRRALEAIRKNIALCRAAGQTRVLKWDIAKNLACLAGRDTLYDLVFMDPPYGTELAATVLEHLEKHGILGAGAQIVIEHARNDLPEPGPAFELTSQRTYGRTMLSFIGYTGGG